MSANAPAPGPRTLDGSLSALRHWQAELAAALEALRRWALDNRLADENAVARIAYLERRVATDRMVIAFAGENSRVTSDLVEALFFADGPAGTARPPQGFTAPCPTEILHDASRPPSIRLLPAATFETPRALREYLDDAAAWREWPLDPVQASSRAAAMAFLVEASSAPPSPGGARAAARLPAGDGSAWRYAVVNLDHPLLAQGLAILDVKGAGCLANEPELSVHRLADADAVVLVLPAETGATEADVSLWREHLAAIDGLPRKVYVALDGIDVSRWRSRSDSEFLAWMERRVNGIAERLAVDPARVFPLSARQGLAARLEDDRDALAMSRVFRLEQALARDHAGSRRIDHAAAAGAETRLLLREAATVLASRRRFVEEQLAELGQLHAKNLKLLDTLGKRAALERLRLEEVRTALAGLRAVHGRHAEELAGLLDPEATREAGTDTRLALRGTTFSGRMATVMADYFRERRARLERAVAVIADVRTMMATENHRFARSWGLAPVELVPFATDRFLLEIDRLEEQATREFRSASVLLTHGRRSLAEHFHETVALKALRVFEIADREVRAWMNAFIRPLEAQLATLQEQGNARAEGIARMRSAESGLLERMDDLGAFVRECAQRESEREEHQRRLARLIDTRDLLAAPGGD